MKGIVNSIIPLVLILSIVVIVLIVAGVKAQKEKGDEDVIKNAYIYLVLFATLMMTIGGSVGAFMAVADIIAPAPYYQTFEEFRNQWHDRDFSDLEAAEKKMLPEKELKARYEAMVAAERIRKVERAQNSLIKSFGWIVIPLPVFIYFQRRLVQKNQ